MSIICLKMHCIIQMDPPEHFSNYKIFSWTITTRGKYKRCHISKRTHQPNSFLCITGSRHTWDDESMTNTAGYFKLAWYVLPGGVTYYSNNFILYFKFCNCMSLTFMYAFTKLLRIFMSFCNSITVSRNTVPVKKYRDLCM